MIATEIATPCRPEPASARTGIENERELRPLAALLPLTGGLSAVLAG